LYLLEERRLLGLNSLDPDKFAKEFRLMTVQRGLKSDGHLLLPNSCQRQRSDVRTVCQADVGNRPAGGGVAGTFSDSAPDDLVSYNPELATGNSQSEYGHRITIALNCNRGSGLHKQLAKYVGEEITIKGWLYNLRSSGKILFPQLRDGTGIVQCVVLKSAIQPELGST